MAKILYISAHAVLEFEEVKILRELKHEVFCLHGSYMRGETPAEVDKRPGIKGMKPNQHLLDLAIQCSRANIHEDLLVWADILIVMHKIDWLPSADDWLRDTLDKCKRHNVQFVWRTIGQSHSKWEKIVKKYSEIKIVRYSPTERRIPNFAGEDALIRFSVDSKEYINWRGVDNRVHVFGQSLKERATFCGYHLMEAVTNNFPRVMYGTKNARGETEEKNIVDWAGGAMSYEDLKTQYREASCAFYFGSIPASYTLTFIEMMMTGTPLVCAGKRLFNMEKHFPNHDLLEIPDIIENGVNGFVSDDINELRGFVKELLRDEHLRKTISKGARETALKLFDKQKNKRFWKEFLNGL